MGLHVTNAYDDPGDDVRSGQTIAAIEAQLAAAERMDVTIADAYDRLRLLDARIDETVTRTVELSVSQTDDGSVAGLGVEVDSIVGDMEALRQAIEETPESKNGETFQAMVEWFLLSDIRDCIKDLR